MNENSTEEKIVAEPAEQSTAKTAANGKKKWIILCVALLVYSLIIVGITIKVDRVIIAKQFEKSWQDAFGGFIENEDDGNNSNGIFDNTDSEETQPAAEATPISLNQTVTVGDVMELTLESSEWLDEIKPSNTERTYSYKSDIPGEKFFVVKGKAKNIAGESLDISYAQESQIAVNGTYKASVSIEAEESDGSSFFGEIKPLQTLNVIIYASVSDELYDLCENVELTLNLLSDSSKVGYFYDNDYPHETYVIEFNNTAS